MTVKQWVRMTCVGLAMLLALTGCAAPSFLQPVGNDTTVTVHFEETEESYTFSGEDAEYLTELLRDLRYDPEALCDCLPAYRVDTAIAAGYGIHTDEGYARCAEGQATLTADQIARVVSILDWAHARLPKATTTTTTAPPATAPTRPAEHRINGVPPFEQMTGFPTGCESVCAVMLLRYAGVEISVADLVDHHLPTSQNFYRKDGKRYGPSPYEYFVGDPRSVDSYGCMAPVIEKALTSALDGNGRVENATGATLSELCDRYIAYDIPVIIWATIDMVEPTYTDSWYLPDGTRYTWPDNEHCFVLVGYDEKYYYFNDPYTGTTRRGKFARAEQRYAQLGSQALAVLPR